MSTLKEVLFLSFLTCVISYNPVLASPSDGEDAEHFMRAIKKARGTVEGSQAIPQAAQISAPQERTVERKQPQQNAPQLSQATATVKKQIRGSKPVETPRAESAPHNIPTHAGVIPPVNGHPSVSAQPLKFIDTTHLRLALEQLQRSSRPMIPSVLSAPNSHQTTAQARVERAQNQQVQPPLQLASLNSLTTLNLFQHESPDFQEALWQDALIQAMSLYTGHQQHFIDRWASVLKKLPYTTLREIHLSGALRDQFVEDAPYWNIDTYRTANKLEMKRKNLVLPPFYPNGTLSQITDLNLASNNLITVQGLGKLTNLISLDLSDNKLLDRIEGLEALTNLRTLSVAGTPLSRLEGLQNLTNLTNLQLSQAQMNNPAIAAVVNSLPRSIIFE